MKIEFSITEFRKNTQIPNFTTIRTVGAELGARVAPERQTGMTKLILALRNYANASKNECSGNTMSGCGPHSSGSGR